MLLIGLLLGAIAGRAQGCEAKQVETWVEALRQRSRDPELVSVKLGECGEKAIAPLQKALDENSDSADWKSSKGWAFQASLIETLTASAETIQGRARSLEKENLETAIADLENAIFALELFGRSFANANLGKVFGQDLNTIQERQDYIAGAIAKLDQTQAKLSDVLWWRENREKVLSGGLVAIAVLGYGSVLWLRPLWLLHLPVKFKFKICKFDIELPLGVMRWLKYQPRVLDRWVEGHLAAARAAFERVGTVKERKVHIPLPAMLDGELLAEPSGQDLRNVFSKKRFCLLVTGEGGAGKTSLAYQIARWAMAAEAKERPCGHPMLPVPIEQELATVESGRDPLLEAIRGQLNVLVGAETSVAEELVEQLLRKRRLLVIVDHLSEMTDITRAKIRPQDPTFAVNALVVTSRLEDDLKGPGKICLQPLRVEGNRLSKFIDGYLEWLGKRDLLEDEEYFEACRQLTRLVGEREITVLLARLYAEQLLAKLKGDAASDLPENIPELMLSYLNRLNRGVDASKRRDERSVHRDAQIVAWSCLQQTFQPAPAPRAVVEEELSGTDARQRLEYLETDLRLLQQVEPDKIRFLLDPLAEYLAALQVVEERGESDEAWQKFFTSIATKPVALEQMRGFLLAVRGSCQAKQEQRVRIPDFVADKLGEKAGLNPADLERANQDQNIRLLIADLRVKGDRTRVIGAAQRLGEYGPAAKWAAMPLERLLQKADSEIVTSAIAGLQGIGEAGTTGLAQALQDKRPEIREQAARALSEMECDRSRILPDLVEALGDESEKVRELALSVLKRCGPDASEAVRGLIEILTDGSEVEELRRDAALALGAIRGEAAMIALRTAYEERDLGKRLRLAAYKVLQQLGEPLPVLADLLEPEMVAIPGGKFWMGSPETERVRARSEGPQHEVEVGPFLLGKYPVTQAEWLYVATLLPQVNRELEPDPSEFKGDNRPVEKVSWLDAVEFCDRLTQDTGRDYRLPTEAEWEYACRAGTTTAYHFGEEITPKLANYDRNRKETTPVGSYRAPNGFGLHDMHGNVWEWCQDPWHEYENKPEALKKNGNRPWQSKEEETTYVLRGGSWAYFPGNCRAASRSSTSRRFRSYAFGFRVACGGPRT